MPKKSKKRVEIKYPEIAVFALSKGSQMNEQIINSENYGHVLRLIENTMRMNNVVSDKVGISGYKEDVVAYIVMMINLCMYKDMEIDLMEDTNEYDPDYMPNNFTSRSKF
ncbi:MAG: hypothetical protein HQ449_06325 [Chitinophagaceae bacterium]|nr:hypothetical protein [Chitinophagaceae bacterium]